MQFDLLKKLCCPMDKGLLEVEVFRQKGTLIQEALMTCSVCKRYYPVIAGVPIMSPDEYREKSLEEPILKRWGYQIPDKNSFKLLDSLTESPDS